MIRRIFLAAALMLAAGSASAAEKQATAFGDSFTAPSTSWYYKLELGNTNFAKSGAVANPALTDLAGRRLSTQVKKWTNAGKPVRDAAIVFIGINDCRLSDSNLEGSKTAYRSAVAKINTEVVAKGVELILVAIPNLGALPIYKGTPEQAAKTACSQAWNTFVKDTAAIYSATVVDLYNVLNDPTLIGPDKLHPNGRGQRAIANAIAAKL